MKKEPKDENAALLATVVKAYLIKNGLTEITITREDMEIASKRDVHLTMEVADKAKTFKLFLLPLANPFNPPEKLPDVDIN